MKSGSIVFFLFLILQSCGKNERDLAMDKKATALVQKEKDLIRWEKELFEREEAVLKKEENLKVILSDSSTSLTDSTSLSDTLAMYDPRIIGTWQVRMLCTETTCQGSAIGDTKSEQWIVAYENNIVMAKVLSNNKVVRIYTGVFKENGLFLSDPHQVDGGTQITVHLHFVNENKMEGKREIQQSGTCRIVYSLEVDKL